MALPYDRKFNAGRQSEQLYNEELHKIYESVRHLTEKPESGTAPDGKLEGSLWLELPANELKYFNIDERKWINVFSNKFQIVDQITDDLTPAAPVRGQLWISGGVLMYYDGVQWQPVKAMAAGEDDINLAAFESFFIISPVKQSGGYVVDNDYEAAVNGGKLDYAANSEFAVKEEEFGPNWDCPEHHDDGNPLFIPSGVKSQFLVPNLRIDRVFLDNKLETNYEKVSNVVFQMKAADVVGKTLSAVHVNPGRLTSLTKRLIKVDLNNPTIRLSPANTEFYGFRSTGAAGKFLRPSRSQDSGDYITTPDGIVLNYPASQNYKYVLAISYNFTWIWSSGSMKHVDSRDSSVSYYVPDFGGPLNVFVEGMDLDHTKWTQDGLGDIVEITEEDSYDLDQVYLMRSARREYGYIRETTLDGYGVIAPLRSYTTPLIIVNGEVMHPTLGDYYKDGSKYFVSGAVRNMTWCIVELYDAVRYDDMFYSADKVVDTIGSLGIAHTWHNDTPVIKFDIDKITPEDGVVLFINGLMINTEDIVRDNTYGLITCEHLETGMPYVLLKDKYHNLYDRAKMIPAFAAGRIDESLVYMDDEILCNGSVVLAIDTPAIMKKTAVHGEVRHFMIDSEASAPWKMFNSVSNTWDALSTSDVTRLEEMTDSYENTLSAVQIKVPFSLTENVFQIYSFNFASTIDQPLIVRSVDAVDQDDFTTEVAFPFGYGALSVWVNGVRQFIDEKAEKLDGSGFVLPQKVTGKVTYIIEKPEDGAAWVCKRWILGPDKLYPNSTNVYHDPDMSLYPGRVCVYVSGLRLAKEQFVIIDNHTLMINTSSQLIGGPDTFPTDTVKKPDGGIATVHRSHYDEIMVEVRPKDGRQEREITYAGNNSWELSIEEYRLPLNLLEAKDEILMFINGQFTGLRTNIGYRKDRTKGCLTLLSGTVIDTLNAYPLWRYFQTNQEAYFKWKERTGKTVYEPTQKNKIILEWR